MLTILSPTAVFNYCVLVASTEDNPAYLSTSYCHRPYHPVSGYVGYNEYTQLADESVVD